MKRKIKITEQQLNYIVENIVRKSKVNHKTSKAKYLKNLRQLNEETIDEEVLDEGAKEWLMIAAMLFPSLSKAGAVEKTKELNLTNQQMEMIMAAKGDVDKGDTYTMAQDTSNPTDINIDTVGGLEDADRGYDLIKDSEHGIFLKSLNDAEKNVIFGEDGFQQFFLAEIVLGTTWDSIKDGTYEQYISKLNSVLSGNKKDSTFLKGNKLGKSSIKYFTDHFGEDTILSLQQKLANAGYTQYKPDGKKGKSNIDGDFGVGTGKMLIDMLYKRLQAIKDKTQKVGGKFKKINIDNFGDASKNVALTPTVQSRD
tara:strand:+ start:2535 stop:3467 length:933 start_codon:yes stop_codon:yes gene_type:complete